MSKYFEWLKDQVDFLDFPERYDRLFSALDSVAFVYKHPMDKNRAAEALYLRGVYHETTHGNAPTKSRPPTMLELFISIAKRMNYICASFDEDKTKEIFWRLLSNIDLAQMSDPVYESLGGDKTVIDILTKINERKYEMDGRGNIFPMARPRQNQREIEIWYQMNQYLSDPNGEDLKSY